MTATTPDITITTLGDMKRAGEKIAVLTVYDASFAGVLERAGVDVLLVGDSLGMVVQGHDSTLPVSIDEMVYHSHAVARTRPRALLVTDMPFLSYATPDQALRNAARLMGEGGARVVKLEGGAVMLNTVALLSERGIPVCAHLGLLPQSVHRLGGYHVQGRSADAAQQLIDDAVAMEQAGAVMLVLECVPQTVAQTIAARLEIPVIGIGASADCDGQVLVLYDLLGITTGHRPRFVKDFMQGAGSIEAAVTDYVAAVRAGSFPGPEHCYD